MSYRDGFEDAVELCLVETRNAESKENAIAKIDEILELIKEDKIQKLKQMLWAIRR